MNGRTHCTSEHGLVGDKVKLICMVLATRRENCLTIIGYVGESAAGFVLRDRLSIFVFPRADFQPCFDAGLAGISRRDKTPLRPAYSVEPHGESFTGVATFLNQPQCPTTGLQCSLGREGTTISCSTSPNCSSPTVLGKHVCEASMLVGWCLFKVLQSF